jgi:hypothetical protein
MNSTTIVNRGAVSKRFLDREEQTQTQERDQKKKKKIRRKTAPHTTNFRPTAEEGRGRECTLSHQNPLTTRWILRWSPVESDSISS